MDQGYEHMPYDNRNYRLKAWRLEVIPKAMQVVRISMNLSDDIYIILK